MLRFLPLCDTILRPLSTLSVAEDETHLIAPTDRWLREAMEARRARTFGVFADGPVGLISLVDPRVEDDTDHFQMDCLYIWRIMVDHRARGQGHGRAIMGFVRHYATLTGLSGVSLTTKDREPANARAFYERLGFAPTGRRLAGEIELVWHSEEGNAQS